MRLFFYYYFLFPKSLSCLAAVHAHGNFLWPPLSNFGRGAATSPSAPCQHRRCRGSSRATEPPASGPWVQPQSFHVPENIPGTKTGTTGRMLVGPSLRLPLLQGKGRDFPPFFPKPGSWEGQKRCTCPKGRGCPAGGRPQGQQRLLALLRSILSALTQRACVQAGGGKHIYMLKGRFAASQPAAVCAA